MADAQRFGEAMQDASGIRPVRRWRILLAHDATASTCDAIALAVEDALGNVDLTDASSVEAARVALQHGRFHLCLVCLDLPPVPTGGARLAQAMLAQGLPVILITRSLRWLPPNAPELRELPWISPDAPPEEVAEAVTRAISAVMASREAALRRGSLPTDAALERSPSWAEIEMAAPLSAGARQ